MAQPLQLQASHRAVIVAAVKRTRRVVAGYYEAAVSLISLPLKSAGADQS